MKKNSVLRGCRFIALAIPLLCGCRDKREEPALTKDPAKSSAVASVAVMPSVAMQPIRPPPPVVPMIRFAAGKFLMGMADNVIGGDYSDMQPIHQVQVPAFSMDVLEVTVAQYKACVDAGACTSDGLLADKMRENMPYCNWGESGYENDPINCVTWDQADAYCRWVGKELPTEEMWEYAAGGPKKRDFPWGRAVSGHPWGMPDDESAYVGSGCDSEERERNPARTFRSWGTCPGGQRSKADTPEGLKDMASNVSEWTSSAFCPYSKKNCVTKEKSVRGGHNRVHQSYFYVAVRRAQEMSVRSDKVGFRCAKREEG